jgi:serine phosphatase RsbU (regulator of sigma subunit)
LRTRSDIAARSGRTFSSLARRSRSGEGQELDPLWLALDRIIEHVRALVRCDAASFQIVDPEKGSIEPVAGWFATPALGAALEPFLRRAYDRERPGLTEAALERGRPLLLPRLEDWEAAPRVLEVAREAIGNEAAARAWDVYRRCSVISCPVQASLGRTLGVLVIVTTGGERTLTRSDLRVVQALADLASLALERSELLEAEAGRARSELMLKQASEEISRSLELDEVYVSIVEHAIRVTGASKALFTRLQPSSQELVPAAGVGYSDDVLRRRVRVGVGMLGRVARSRRPYLSRPEDAQYWNRRLVENEGVASFMHAPIELGPRLFGVITVSHEEEERFGDADLDLLVKLARSSAAGIANAIDFERERRIARALTLGFVPGSLPEVSGFEVGLLYEPAASQPTGGDVYGAWETPAGEVAILVGDVAGKGVETAALSAMARFFIEAHSWESRSPAEVLERANEMLRSRLPADSFVTAFYGVLTEGRLVYCNAGHLSPILIRAAGGRSEPGGRGLPLGIEESPGYRENELKLDTGDLLFAYTDGLVEARREGKLFGADRLGGLVEAADPAAPVSDLVRHVHDELRHWADDAVALALRRRG